MKIKSPLFSVVLFLVSVTGSLQAQRVNSGLGLFLQPRFTLAGTENFYAPDPNGAQRPLSEFEDWELKPADGFALGISGNLRFALSRLDEENIFWLDFRPQLGLSRIRPYKPEWGNTPPVSPDEKTWVRDKDAIHTAYSWSLPLLATVTHWLPYNGVSNRMLAAGIGLSVNNYFVSSSSDSLVPVKVFARLATYPYYSSYSYIYVFKSFVKAEVRVSYIWLSIHEKEWELSAGFSYGAGKQYAAQIGITHRFVRADYSENDRE